MIRVARRLPDSETMNFHKQFTKEPSFVKVLANENQSGEAPKDIKGATYLYSNEEDISSSNLSAKKFKVREVSVLLSFNSNFKVVLSSFEKVETKEKSYVTNVWKVENNIIEYKEYINGELNFSDKNPMESDAGIVIDLFDGLTEAPAEKEDELVTALYDPTSCILQGRCCTFSGVTYRHCGKYCGNWENSGGGVSINALDSICYSHDLCLQGSTNRCTCHDRFLASAAGVVAPGDTTIRNGIRGAKVLEGCPL